MIAASMLPEFDHEFATLRVALERVPEDNFDYQPHEKSMSMARLAGHLAEIADWMVVTIETDELDFAAGNYEPYVMTSKDEMLTKFDDGVAKARECLSGASDEVLMQPWTMRSGDTVHMTMPKVAVIRSFVMNHMVHHRAQLGVYFRLNDIPVPETYGPSADEGNM